MVILFFDSTYQYWFYPIGYLRHLDRAEVGNTQ